MIEIDQLRFLTFGPFTVSVAPGEVVGLRGPSGAGKSLLLRAIADLDPHHGSVRLNGTDAAAMAPSEWRRRVGLLPAECHWWAERVGEHFGNPTAALPRMRALGFDEAVLDWEVARLSSGERQRLGLVRLLEQTCEVLLLDEPTANLDPDSTRLVEGLIRDCPQAVLLVSHDVTQLERIADRRFLLDKGLTPE